MSDVFSGYLFSSLFSLFFCLFNIFYLYVPFHYFEKGLIFSNHDSSHCFGTEQVIIWPPIMTICST